MTISFKFYIYDIFSNGLLANNIIILTVGTNNDVKSIGFNKKSNEDTSIENMPQHLLSKMTSTIKLENINKKSIDIIVKKEMERLKKKYNSQKIIIGDNVLMEIIKESNYQELGAQKIKNIIYDKIENIIIDNIIDNKKEININTIFSK